MLRTTKNMKDKYEKIQNFLFTLIPEKWESIYLYASVIMGATNSQTGEMFFYYIPKGILKKRPINVYEVPKRFNINEEQYLNVVRELYECIKDLKQDFLDTDQDLWTNLTISINNLRFKVEYNYDMLPSNEKECEENRVIWRYKYLNIGGEKKEEQRILQQYFSSSSGHKNEIYETGFYIKNENSSVRFDREDSLKMQEKVVEYEKEMKDEKQEFLDTEVVVNIQEIEDNENKQSKNQILNF